MYKRSFCQDRLGTNIGKTQTEQRFIYKTPIREIDLSSESFQFAPVFGSTHDISFAFLGAGKDIIVQSSGNAGELWHLNTRSGQRDWGATDSRAFFSYYGARDVAAASQVSHPMTCR